LVQSEVDELDGELMAAMMHLGSKLQLITEGMDNRDIVYTRRTRAINQRAKLPFQIADGHLPLRWWCVNRNRVPTDRTGPTDELGILSDC
jgi:hypothetical protein